MSTGTLPSAHWKYITCDLLKKLVWTWPMTICYLKFYVMMLLGILTYILHLDNKANCTMKTNFITVVFNEAPHGYSKAAIWANTPVHAIQLPWRRVSVDLLLLVLRPTTTWWAIAMLLLLLLLLLSGSGHKHTICLFSNVHKAKSLFQLKPYYQYWLISAPCYAIQEARVPRQGSSCSISCSVVM